MPNQKQDTPVFDVGKATTRQESNRTLPFHTTYNSLKHLSQAGEVIMQNITNRTQAFKYDQYGNRTFNE